MNACQPSPLPCTAPYLNTGKGCSSTCPLAPSMRRDTSTAPKDTWLPCGDVRRSRLANHPERPSQLGPGWPGVSGGGTSVKVAMSTDITKGALACSCSDAGSRDPVSTTLSVGAALPTPDLLCPKTAAKSTNTAGPAWIFMLDNDRARSSPLLLHCSCEANSRGGSTGRSHVPSRRFRWHCTEAVAMETEDSGAAQQMRSYMSSCTTTALASGASCKQQRGCSELVA